MAPRKFGEFNGLEAGMKWFQQDGGRVTITREFWSGPRVLPDGCRLALALTELCSERGIGRVYVLARHPDPANIHRERERSRAAMRFQEVPELCYVPELWTAEEIEAWPNLKPIEQLSRLCARNWVVDRLTVLPIDVQLVEKAPKTLFLQAGTTATVTLYIHTQLYAGLTKDMRKMCNKEPEFTSNFDRDRVTGCHYMIKNNSLQSLKSFRVDTGEALLDQFEKWHREAFENGNELVMTFETLMNFMIDAGLSAVSDGHAYGEQGEVEEEEDS
ncbi:hypothetical protein PV08_07179 [Exophiala spinifera]|uniref:Uncharacterized protein n=1 Tax=Exophiala spinifera TaxID=91928 RepID=A0A0D1ZNI2_9EURO|nr:uncharacterized protein PV08_07179 [Exophiala spinifera]KIW14397.1 hypothetical protein PV08_07179 [Exophiala spinifera]